MKNFDRITGSALHVASRRKFLHFVAKSLAFIASVPFVDRFFRNEKSIHASAADALRGAPDMAVKVKKGARTLLKNGYIVDGSGTRGFNGSLLFNGGTIEKIFREGEEISFEGNSLDCDGHVIAPGFIDAHSHMDRYLPVKGHDNLKMPFTAQGITTFIAGNCGYGAAGYKRNSEHMDKVGFVTKDLYDVKWYTMEKYFQVVKGVGMSHNMMVFVGHGTTRASIRGFDPSPLTPSEMKEMLALLEEAMDQGACGVSLGLQYEPGIFADTAELREVAKLVKKKNKILSVHLRAYSALSGSYPVSTMKVLFDYVMPFDGYTPHNILALEEMLGIARETGVRLQVSHLIFVGERTFKTYGDALKLIEQAAKDGVDVKFDTYSYHCGTSRINVFISPWFLAKVPGAYNDKKMLARLEKELTTIKRFLGYGYEDIQITYANNDALNKYNGMFLTDIAKQRGVDPFVNFTDFARLSGGTAAVLNHRYSNMEIVEALTRHPLSIFMTDAIPALEGVQNPACSGAFPRFFQLAREKNLAPLEEIVYKMTGAAAERFGVKNRGLLREGYAADITVFDRNAVRDNNTLTKTDMAPWGIDAVFINGRRVLDQGKPDPSIRAGVVLV